MVSFGFPRGAPKREETVSMNDGSVSVDDPQTRKGSFQVGLIGSGIQASGSPRLHMEEGRQQNLKLKYDLLDLDHEPEGAAALERVLAGAEKSGYAGVNVTHPCKQRVIP